MSAKVFNTAKGTEKTVKNLGWLLRNWRQVESFSWYDVHSLYYPETVSDGFLMARLDDGRVFHTSFASYTVFVHWLNRPVFRGLPVTMHKNTGRDGKYAEKPFTLTIGEYEKLVA